MRSFKILGLLISYPQENLLSALPECMDILRLEKLVSEAVLKDVEALASWMIKQDIMDLQEIYVSLFDRTPSLSLHLFEHVHGDSRDRGQALVDLGALYREKNLMAVSDELPDYLPMFLEYLSVLPMDEAKEGLESVAPVIEAISARLRQRESLYASVIDATLSAAKRKPDMKAVEMALALASGKAPDFEEMDKAWEEQFALRTPDPTAQQGCPKASAMLTRMNQMAERAS